MSSNKDILTFKNFLSKNIVTGKKTVYTHTDCGPPYKKYNISDLKKFYKLCSKVIGKIDLHITEKPKEVSPFTIDIDFKFSAKHGNRQYGEEDVKRIIQYYTHFITKYIKSNKKKKKVFLFEKDEPTYDKKNDQYKDGIHLIYPYAALDMYQKYIITDEVKEAIKLKDGFSNLPVTNNLDDIFDVCVINRNNWCMYGSKKHNGSLYKLTKVYNYDLQEEDINNYINKNLVSLFSVRKFSLEEKLRVKKKIGDIEWSQKIKYIENKYNLNKNKKKSKIKKNNTISPELIEIEEDFDEPKKTENPEVAEAIKLVNILSPKRAEDYSSWINVIWCLHNISKRLFSTCIEFSKKCNNKFDYGSCRKVWDDARNEGLKIGSLRMWARQDNPKAYEKIIDESVDILIKEAESGTHYDIAKVIYCIYNCEYVCTSIRHFTWYQFQKDKHKWVEVDGCYTLDLRMSEELTKRFAKLNAYYYSKASTKEGLERDNLLKQAGTIHKIIKDLKKTPFKSQVMNQCARLFYNLTFAENLDSNRDLIGFNNGVYDLSKGIFRSGSPDDLITLTVGYDYKIFNENDSELKEIYKYFESVQVNYDLREYVITLLASYLDGYTREQKFIIWTGGGANGKSTTIELFQYAFGEYCGTIPISLLTKKRGSSSSASPELAGTRGRRFIVFQEPEKNDKINVGYMKELTGGDWIYARQLYKEGMRFKPQFKLLLTCNRLPGMDGVDGGTWRRVRVTPFGSKFVDTPNPNISKNEFKMDKTLPDRIKSWNQAFIWLLLNVYYVKYKKHGLVEPSTVTKYTDKYKKDSDVYLEFISENLKLTEKNKDYETITMIYTTFKSWYRESYATNNCPSKKDIKEYFHQNDYNIRGNNVHGIKFYADDQPLIDDLDEL